MSTDDREEFARQRSQQIKSMASNAGLRQKSADYFHETVRSRYSYQFDWCGLPIIQYPQDIVAMQELIWTIRPQRIVETGVARGGSLVFSASMLELLRNDGRVIGVDIDIRKHNREAIENHPLGHRIDLVEGSSIDPITIERVTALVGKIGPTLLFLDSNHTHEHVLAELRAYAPLVAKGSYIVVFDTVIEDLPEEFSHDRPWGPGNSPKTAVRAFLNESSRFVIDVEREAKLLLTVCPDGFLKCVGDV
jgi:cephalosporin hydroxylase